MLVQEQSSQINGVQVPLRQVQILGGGLQIDVAEQHLDGAKIRACFE
jgi:hypothetical protein